MVGQLEYLADQNREKCVGILLWTPRAWRPLLAVMCPDRPPSVPHPQPWGLYYSHPRLRFPAQLSSHPERLWRTEVRRSSNPGSCVRYQLQRWACRSARAAPTRAARTVAHRTSRPWLGAPGDGHSFGTGTACGLHLAELRVLHSMSCGKKSSTLVGGDLAADSIVGSGAGGGLVVLGKNGVQSRLQAGDGALQEGAPSLRSLLGLGGSAHALLV